MSEYDYTDYGYDNNAYGGYSGYAPTYTQQNPSAGAMVTMSKQDLNEYLKAATSGAVSARADAPHGTASSMGSGLKAATNAVVGGGASADSSGMSAYQAASLALAQQSAANQAANQAADNALRAQQLAQQNSQFQQTFGLDTQRVANQVSQFDQTFGLQQQQVQGTPIDWAKLGLQAMGMSQDDIFRNTQLAQTGNLQAQDLMLRGYQVTQSLQLQAQQQALATSLGQGDQAQGWAKLQLASEAQDLQKLLGMGDLAKGQAQIDALYQQMGLDKYQTDANVAIEQRKADLQAQQIAMQSQAIGAQASADMARAQAANLQAQAALRGVEVQLQLGNGNLQLGKDQLEWAKQQGLMQLDQQAQDLGLKAYVETGDLNLRQYLGDLNAATSRYATDVGAQTSIYNTQVGAQSDIYRAQLAAAVQQQQNQQQAETERLNLIAGLRGPRDYFQYLKTIRAAQEGLPGGLTALGSGQQGLTGSPSPTGPMEPVSLQSFMADTGMPAPWQQGQGQFPVPQAPTFPNAPTFPTWQQPTAPATSGQNDLAHWMSMFQVHPPATLPGATTAPGTTAVPTGTTPGTTTAPGTGPAGTVQQVTSTDSQGRVRVGVLDPQGNFVPTDGLGPLDVGAATPSSVPPGAATPGTGSAASSPASPTTAAGGGATTPAATFPPISFPSYQAPTPPQIPQMSFAPSTSVADLYSAWLASTQQPVTPYQLPSLQSYQNPPFTLPTPSQTTPATSSSAFNPLGYVQQAAGAQGVTLDPNNPATPPATGGGGGGSTPPASPGGSGGTPAPAGTSIEAMNAAHPWAPPITQAIIDAGMSPDNYFAMYAGNSPTPPTATVWNSNPVPDASGGIYNFSPSMNYWDYIRLGGAPPAVPIPGYTDFTTQLTQRVNDSATPPVGTPGRPANGRTPTTFSVAAPPSPAVNNPNYTNWLTGGSPSVASAPNAQGTENVTGYSTPFTPMYNVTTGPQGNQVAGYSAPFSPMTEQGGGEEAGGVMPEYQGIYNAVQSYDQGTNYVPSDQLAMLHQGEAVVPADQNPSNPYGYGMPDYAKGWTSHQLWENTNPQVNYAGAQYGNPNGASAEEMWQHTLTPTGQAYTSYEDWMRGGGYDPTQQYQPQAAPSATQQPLEDMNGGMGQPTAAQPVANQPPHAQPSTPGMPMQFSTPGTGTPVPGYDTGGMTSVLPAQETIQRLFGGLPAPNQVPYRLWNKLLPTEQDMALAAYEAMGWSIPDVATLIDRSRPGAAAFQGSYAGVGK